MMQMKSIDMMEPVYERIYDALAGHDAALAR